MPTTATPPVLQAYVDIGVRTWLSQSAGKLYLVSLVARRWIMVPFLVADCLVALLAQRGLGRW